MQLNRVRRNYYQCEKPPKTGHRSGRHSPEIIIIKKYAVNQQVGFYL